jgi:DNA mismatch repair protein MSH5
MYECLLASMAIAVKYQANPLVIYTSTKCEESFLAALQQSGMVHIVWLSYNSLALGSFNQLKLCR